MNWNDPSLSVAANPMYGAELSPLLQLLMRLGATGQPQPGPAPAGPPSAITNAPVGSSITAPRMPPVRMPSPPQITNAPIGGGGAGLITNAPVGGARPSAIGNAPVGAGITLPTLPSWFSGLGGQDELPVEVGGEGTRSAAPPPAPAGPFSLERLPTGPQDIFGPLEAQMENARVEEQLLRSRQAREAESARAPTIAAAMRDTRALISAGRSPEEAMRETLASTSFRGRVTREDLAPVFLTEPAAATPAAPAPAQVTTPPGPNQTEPAAPQDPAATPAAATPPAAAPTRAAGAPVIPTGPSGPRPTLSDIPQPDYSRVLEEYQRARPADYQPDPQRNWMMALLGGLSNVQFRPGERLGYGLSGAISGGAQGYARESAVQEARGRETGREQRDWQRGLAGMVSGQEDARYNRQVQSRTFDRDTRHQDRSYDLQRAGLGLQAEELRARREGQAGQQLLQRLRINEMLQRSGMQQDAGSVLMDSVPDVVAGRVTMPGLTVPMPGANGAVEQVPISAAYQRLQSRLGSREFMAANPMLVGNAQALNTIVEMQLGELVTQTLIELQRTNPEQFQATIRRLGQIRASRPRAGTGVSFGEGSP